MSRQKLARFRQNTLNLNIIEPGKEFYEKCKGNWHNFYFKNENPLVLELACGRGEYSVGLAEIFPQKNFVGVDIKGARLWQGSTIALEKKLYNVAFLRAYIQNLEEFFSKKEVSEIWIIHPDPRPRNKDMKRRLTSPRFLDMYKKLLRPQGWVRLKTDSLALFEYSLEVLKSYSIKNLSYTSDLYNSDLLSDHYDIRTRYEKIFEDKGHLINYLKFQFEDN